MQEISWIRISLIAIYILLFFCIAVAKNKFNRNRKRKEYSSMPAWFTKWEQVLLTFEDKTVTEKFNIIMTHQKMLLLAEQEAKGNKGSEPLTKT
jgi:hypothetical protein